MPGQPEDGQPFRYTGRRYDPETGLYYYRARYYSATLGRFLQVDPIGYEDNMNLYGYTNNDPVNYNDPSGRNGCAVANFRRSSGSTSCVNYDSQLKGGKSEGKRGQARAAGTTADAGATSSGDRTGSKEGTRSNSGGLVGKFLGRVSSLWALAKKLAELNDATNEVYRGMSGTDIQNALKTGFILPKNVNGTLTPEQHARDSDQLGGSQYVSLTHSRAVAENFAVNGWDPGYYVAVFDTQSLVHSGNLVFHTGVENYDPGTKENVLMEGELLFRGPLPVHAIRRMYKVGGN